MFVEQVHFGAGSLECLPAVLRSMGVNRALVITDKGVAGSGAMALAEGYLRRESIHPILFDDTQPEPGADVADDIVERFAGEGVNGVVGLGGGSCLDTAKVVAIMLKHGGSLRDYIGRDRVKKPGLPMVMVPTTAGTGSESTPNALFIVDGEKQAVLSKHIMPEVAIVDPELTVSMPPSITASSGLDALVHACESYTSLGATPISEMYSLRAVELIARSIRTAVWRGTDLEARTDMALGSYLAGVAIAKAGTGGVHALAYPLGGEHGVPHGVSNALMFPYVIEWNLPSDLDRFAILAKAIGEKVEGLSPRDAAFSFLRGINVIVQDVGIVRTLDEVGIGESELPSLVEGAARQTRLLKNNPRRLGRDDIEAIYSRAMGA